MPHRLHILITVIVDVDIEVNESTYSEVEAASEASGPATERSPGVPAVRRPSRIDEARHGR